MKKDQNMSPSSQDNHLFAEKQAPMADLPDEYAPSRIQSLDLAGLLQISQMAFHEFLFINVTKQTFRILQYYDAVTVNVPSEGPLQLLLDLALDYVAQEDQQAFKDVFFPESYRKAIQAGVDKLQVTYRRLGRDGKFHWLETTAVQQPNPYGDNILFIVVSVNVDRQKEEEELLRQALAATSGKLEDQLYYSSLTKRTFPGLDYIAYEDGRESPYVFGHLAEELGCTPKELALCTCRRIHPDDKEALLLARTRAEQSGAESFYTEYRVKTDQGTTVWVANYAIRFVDEDGSAGYIHYLTNSSREHALAEQLRLHVEEKLAQNEKIFHMIAQHSDRTLCYYDIATNRARPWNEDGCTNCNLAFACLKELSLEQFTHGDHLLPESVRDAGQMFEDILAGTPSGEANLHIQSPEQERRWFHFKYTSLTNEDKPVAAFISFEDVTERHEHELAYQRYVQSIEFDAEGHLMYIESDLTADRIEHLAGQMPGSEERTAQYSHSDFLRLMQKLGFHYQNTAEAAQYFSRGHLLGLYALGKRQINQEWQVRFRDGSIHWLDTETVLMADPYSGHVKAFFRMMDITEEQEEKLAVLRRAERDAMTGLLRKGVGEERIKAHLDEAKTPGGILIALDLDDLKSINDFMGHPQGDAAITGIAETLKSHFRKDDILIRAGGDEFTLYLPGAGQSVDSVSLSMTALLRKLAGISIGENNERNIHCSAGCAVEMPGTDTYESLFHRADLALYHVKRSGKNNFAFFEPEMLQEDYQFKADQTAAKMADTASETDLHDLMETIAAYFSQMVSFNLTHNQFRVLVSGSEPPLSSGSIDLFWEDAIEHIHPDDRESALSVLSRESLLAAYEKGGHSMTHYIRCLEQTGYFRVEVITHLYTTGVGDICAYLFFRRDVAPESELEVLRLKKLLDISVTTAFEYICLVDVRSKSYSTFSRDKKNTHSIPERADFDTVVRFIRDTQIRPGYRQAYYNAASLDSVLAHMNGQEDCYSYRYMLKDGPREAAFNWYEDSRSELLMTIRKII